MPTVFGGTAFLFFGLALVIVSAAFFLPAAPIVLIGIVLAFVAGRRARAKAGTDDSEPVGPQARWREEASAANH